MELEQAAREASERFLALTETVPHILWKSDPAGHVCWVNGPGRAIMGRTSDELLGVRWHEAVHPEDLPAKLVRWRHALETGTPYESEYRWRVANGEYHWYSIRAAPQRDASGKIIAWFGTCTDVQAKRDAEQKLLELAKSVERDVSQSIVDSLPGLFYMFEAESGRPLRWNANLAKLTGYTAEEIQRMHPLDFFRGQDHALAAACIRDVVTHGRAALEAGIVTKDGRSVPLYFTGTWLEVDGKSCVLGMGLDISERLRAEKRERELEAHLRHSQKLESVGRLAAGIAHEFNNLLTLQQARLGLLLADPRLPPELATHASFVSKAAERAAALTRQLLLFSRKEPLEVRTLSLGEIVSRHAAMLAPILGENIALTVELTPDPVLVDADAGLIEQVLMNLVLNAKDAMTDGGALLISVDTALVKPRTRPAEPPQPFARLVVADSGVGIPSQVQERVFEPFFTTKSVGQGTGLGLSMVYGIIEQHGGFVDLESAPGEGTTFSIYLPLSSGVCERASEVPGVANDKGRETILVVEDEEELRTVLDIMLSEHGYNVFTAENGPEALEVFAREGDAIALVLTDMVMPGGMTGVDVLKSIRAAHPTVKAILSSGYSAEPLAALARAENATLLQKPYPPARLYNVIRALLDAPN